MGPVKEKVRPSENHGFKFDYQRFSRRLKHWHFNHGITQNATSDLLHILNEEIPGMSQHNPVTSSTFLETPRHLKVEQIDLDIINLPKTGSRKKKKNLSAELAKAIADKVKKTYGDYYYFGLEENIRRALEGLPKLPKRILLIMGFDGAPITWSGKLQIWPIMVGFLNIPERMNYVFTAAIFCSAVKVGCPAAIFKDFVPEVNKLHETGLIINGTHVEIRMQKFCMDAPAKAAVLGTKNANGFSSCTKCWVEGDSVNSRVFFDDQTSRERTHEQMLQGLDTEFQKRSCAISEISHINLVDDLPNEYMHLLGQGVMKKLLVEHWIKGADRRKACKLSSQMIREIDARLENLREEKFFPRDFAHYPRTLEYVHKWKATENRAFLLYIGPVILRPIFMEQDKNSTKTSRNYMAGYNNFLRLHVACTILLSEILCQEENILFADEQLKYFVDEYGDLYGTEFISHNIHGLIHLAKDAFFGPLHQVSAFRFENFLRFLLSLVKKPSQAALQIVRRLFEMNACGFETNFGQSNFESIHFSIKHKCGPLIEDLGNPQYALLRSGFINLSLRRVGDRCFLSTSDETVLVSNFATAPDGSVKIIGRKFLVRKDFYVEPVPSSQLGIWEVSELSSELSSWNLNQIKLKYVFLPKLLNSEDSFIVFPMLHFGGQHQEKSGAIFSSSLFPPFLYT